MKNPTLVGILEGACISLAIMIALPDVSLGRFIALLLVSVGLIASIKFNYPR